MDAVGLGYRLSVGSNGVRVDSPAIRLAMVICRGLSPGDRRGPHPARCAGAGGLAAASARPPGFVVHYLLPPAIGANYPASHGADDGRTFRLLGSFHVASGVP